MKKLKIITILGVIAVATYTSTVLVNAKSADSEPAITEHSPEGLKTVGIKLKKPQQQPKISEDQAIENASMFQPNLAEKAKKIRAEYQLVTKEFYALSDAAKEKNPQLKKDGYLNDTPVYIVTFKGVERPTHITTGQSDDDVKKITVDDVSVIVDANSGEVLLGFSYKKLNE